MFERLLLAFCLLLVTVLVSLLVFLGYTAYQDHQRITGFANDCHAVGKVVIEMGPSYHCMTWDEVKERGLEIDAD